LIFGVYFFTISRDILIQGRKKYVKKTTVGCVVDINFYVMKALISAS